MYFIKRFSTTTHMKKITVNDDAIVMKEAFTQQNLDGNDRQTANPPRDRSPIKRSGEVIQVRTATLMDRKNPIDNAFLGYAGSSKHSRSILVFAFLILTSLSILTGTLIVYFKYPKSRAPKCEFELRPTVSYSTRVSSHPHSVAVGDFNNDQHMDLVVANFGFDSVSVFLGYGNNSFASQTTYSMAIGSTPRMVTVGYFNNDTQLDIVVANFGINTIVILLGIGDGTFTYQTTIETSPSHPMYMIVDDFNNDARFDIAFVGVGTDYIGIVLGFGNGIFGIPRYFSTGYDSHPSSIAVGDFNGDQRKDLVVANYGTDNLGVFLGYGDGTFTDQTIFTTGVNSGPYSIAAFDLNNDTHLDLAVVYSDGNEIAIFFGYGNGSFAFSRMYLTGENSNPIFIVIADFNNDNKADITVANNGSNGILLLFGYGNGTFANALSYSTGPRSSPYSIGVGDFNSDKQLDVVIANLENNNIKIFNSYSKQIFGSETIYPNNGNSLSTSAPFVPTKYPLYPIFTSIIYLNYKNQPDTVTNNPNDNGGLDAAKAQKKRGGPAILSAQNTNKFQSISRSISIKSCTKVVEVGDFDRDGRSDLAVANSGANRIDILLGYGNGSFANPLLSSVVDASNPISIAVDDFNNDDRLDLAVANSGTRNIGIFLGYGNGTFSSDVTYYTDDSYDVILIAIGDANNDGQLDIFFANHYSGSVGTLLGSGDGKFLPQTIYYTDSEAYPSSIAVVDFNNDRQLDIAIVNSEMDSIGILLGWGNGTFQKPLIFSTGAYSKPISLAVGDFNNDGNIDVVVSNTLAQEEHILIFLGNGHGNLSIHGKYITGINSKPCSMVIGQFNNDKLLDIAVSNFASKQVGIFLGHDNGTFTSQTTYSTNNIYSPAWLAVGDFNNDSLTDLVVADYHRPIVGVLLAFIDTSFVDRTTYYTGSAAFPASIVIGDFTNDGQLDIVVGNDGTHDITLLINGASGKFSKQTVYSADSTFYPSFIAASDFNNDQQLDIAVANSIVDSVTLLYGQGNGTFGKPSVFSTEIDSSPQSLTIGDFNKDNQTDIVIAHSGTGSVSLLLKIDNGAMKRVETLSTGTGSKPHGLTVEDFDNDGRLDIAVTNNGNANIGIFFGMGDGTFTEQKLIPLGEGIYPIWVNCGDFNNDKKLDIVVSNNVGSTTVMVLLNNGDRSFRIEGTSNIDRTEMNAVGDFDRDGLLDVITCHSYYYFVNVFLGYGNGTFIVPAKYTISGSFPVAITVDDLDKDGRLDVVVVYKNELNTAVYYGYGDGTFSNGQTYSTGQYGMPFSVSTGDFNNDGWIDIAVGMYEAKSIGIFFNYGNRTFSSYTNYLTKDASLHQGISAADFNNDGRLDIIVTETNKDRLGIILGHVNGTFFDEITYFTGNHSYPFSIGLGDFNNDGRVDIAVSNMLSDDIGIFLGYASEDFASTAPKSIGSSSKPVSVAVGDFDNDTCLDVVVADHGANQIVIIQGSGYGTFLSQQTSSTGNGSYPTWVAVEDFNGDQYLDIVVVNSGTNNIAVFLGYGNGTFSSLLISSTGNIYSPVSLSVGHFDSDTYLDVAVASSGNNKVCILFGYGNGSFGNVLCRTSGYDSRPSVVVSGDVNGDNATDVVIANQGSSTIEILTKIC